MYWHICPRHPVGNRQWPEHLCVPWPTGAANGRAIGVRDALDDEEADGDEGTLDVDDDDDDDVGDDNDSIDETVVQQQHKNNNNMTR